MACSLSCHPTHYYIRWLLLTCISYLALELDHNCLPYSIYESNQACSPPELIRTSSQERKRKGKSMQIRWVNFVIFSKLGKWADEKQSSNLLWSVCISIIPTIFKSCWNMSIFKYSVENNYSPITTHCSPGWSICSTWERRSEADCVPRPALPLTYSSSTPFVSSLSVCLSLQRNQRKTWRCAKRWCYRMWILY